MITPASTASGYTTARPWLATNGISTTVIAPVGPLTCRFEPPKIAATAPATTAVTRPMVGPTPVATLNASASGSATMPTVSPAARSRPQDVRSPA